MKESSRSSPGNEQRAIAPTNENQAMLENLIVFVLASFIGFEVISKVPQTLHTPLMSGANAISGITIVGALVVAGMVGGVAAKWIGVAALIVATINVVGGFMVTDRMLQMFKKKPQEKSVAKAGN